MNGNSVALDTSRAIDVMNAQQGVETLLRMYPVIFLPVHVIGELRYGALIRLIGARTSSALENGSLPAVSSNQQRPLRTHMPKYGFG
jgi:predicted nucleic acid-binding protein